MSKLKKTLEFKTEVNKRDMPYQSLNKVWLSEDVDESRRRG